MGEAFIVRKGGVVSETTAAPTITIISEDPTGVTFTLTNNDDNTAVIVYDIDTTQDFVELAAAATSTNITVALAMGTYTLSAFATVVGEVATSATASVEIVVPQYELLYSETVATAKTQIDITGLSIGKDDGLRLVYTMNPGINSDYYIYVNDNNTNSNYTTQRLVGAGSVIGAARYSFPYVFWTTSAGKNAGFTDVKVSNNDRFVYQSQWLRAIGSASSSTENENVNGVSLFSVTSITKLSFVATVSNGFGIGSKIALYKVTEAA
jgi:hypothetical protein